MLALGIIVGIIALIGFLFLLARFVEWLGTRRVNRVKMSYHDFKVRYGLDPRYWILNDGYAEFCYDGNVHSICFDFLDYLRYEVFRTKRDYEKVIKQQQKYSEKLSEAFHQFDQDKEHDQDV